MIVTLWTIALITILVATLAGKTRLSAQVTYYQQQGLADWANISAALNHAEMEVLLLRMPQPPDFERELEELNQEELYRFDGDEIDLYYPQAEDIRVRIYDHAGKINLNEISRGRMRSLLLNKLGDDATDQVNKLMTAWGDWLDLNDDPGINGGAEREYYQSLEPPYDARDGQLETVEELLLIDGFAEVFGDVDMDAAFTLYGENELINLNVATIEAMQLLPGLDDELIKEIVLWRQHTDLSGNLDISRIVPAENMADLRGFLNSRKTTNYYTVMVYKAPSDTPIEAGLLDENTDPQEVELYDPGLTAYAEIIEVRGESNRPRVLKVTPFQTLPLQLRIASVE